MLLSTTTKVSWMDSLSGAHMNTNKRRHLTGMGIHMLKKRRPTDRIPFNMELPIPVR